MVIWQLLARVRESVESLFKPEFVAMMTQSAREILQEAVLKGVSSIFWVGCISSIPCFLCCILLPGGFGQKNKKSPEV